MPLFAVSYYLDKWVAYSKNLLGYWNQFDEAISGALDLYKTRHFKKNDLKELIDRRNKLTTFIDKSNRILSDLDKYKKKFGKENASNELPDVSYLLDAIDMQIMNLIGYRIGLYLSQASIYICLHNINEDKLGDLIFTAQELNRKAFADLRDYNKVFEALLPPLPEKSNAECEEQFTIIEMLRLRRFFDAMQESLKTPPSEDIFNKGYRYLSEAINRAKDNEAWGAMLALTGDLGEYCIERLDNTTLVVNKGLPYYTMERYQTRKKIYSRIKESYQFAETAMSHLPKFSSFIQMKMKNIIKYLTKTIDTMLQDAIFYRSGDEIDLYKEILDQIQEIMLVGDHLRDKFPQEEPLFEVLKIQFNQELNICKELIARKISAQQQEKLEKEELQKELKVKQKHYDANFSKLLAEFPEAERQISKNKQQPQNSVKDFETEEDYCSSGEDEEAYLSDNDSFSESAGGIEPLYLPTLLEEIALAERQNNFLNLIKARFNLADYYRFEAIQCLKAKSTDKAIKQFESAKDVLERCLHSIDEGMPTLSDEAMAEFKLLHDWAGIVLEEVSTQLEKLTQKLKHALDRLDKSRLQAMQSIINAQGMQAWFKPQAPSQEELSEKAKERLFYKEALKKTHQLNSLFQRYKNQFAIQNKRLTQEGFETLFESRKVKIAEDAMPGTEEGPSSYDESLDLISRCTIPIPSKYERRLSCHSFFEPDHKEERKSKRLSFGRLNSDINLQTGLQLTENETIVLSENMIP